MLGSEGCAGSGMYICGVKGSMQGVCGPEDRRVYGILGVQRVV